MRTGSIHPVRRCRFWLLAAVVIVLAMASSAVGQVKAIKVGGAQGLFGALFDFEAVAWRPSNPRDERIQGKLGSIAQTGGGRSPLVER